MKKSGAPEKGDLVRYEWAFDDSQYRTTALVVGEHGIAVKLLFLGLCSKPLEGSSEFILCEKGIREMTVPRGECKIIRTRQGEIVNSVSSA